MEPNINVRRKICALLYLCLVIYYINIFVCIASNHFESCLFVSGQDVMEVMDGFS